MPAFECVTGEGVLRLRRPGTRWLATDPGDGFSRAPAADNISVPEGFEREDLATYVAERRERAGFERCEDCPALLTGADVVHARGARCGPAMAVVTAGLSNPAALPMDTDAGADEDGDGTEHRAGEGHDTRRRHDGTVNVILATDRALDDGALATLLGVAVEAKTATLLEIAGVPGTTTDAVVAGCAPDGERAAFAGSATEVGAAARACVREATRASLVARYGDGGWPTGVEGAEYGVTTERRAESFVPDGI